MSVSSGESVDTECFSTIWGKTRFESSVVAQRELPIDTWIQKLIIKSTVEQEVGNESEEENGG